MSYANDKKFIEKIDIVAKQLVLDGSRIETPEEMRKFVSYLVNEFSIIFKNTRMFCDDPTGHASKYTYCIVREALLLRYTRMYEELSLLRSDGHPDIAKLAEKGANKYMNKHYSPLTI